MEKELSELAMCFIYMLKQTRVQRITRVSANGFQLQLPLANQLS